jgi:hypothetical protein
VVETTRGWGKGYFFTTGEKFKDFQFCLLILPAYLPLKFPLKIPGPISQAKLKPKKKQIAPFKKKNFNGGVAILLKKSLLVNLITFLANNLTCSRSANIVISTTI